MFNASEHLSDIKGKAYLEVKWRLVWFREEKPTWSLETELVSVNEKGALFKALVKDETGRVIATAHKSETPQGFADFIEKAETGAVGRALALVGYGTQFAPDLEEGNRLADSPVERKTVIATPPFANTDKATPPQITGVKNRLELVYGYKNPTAQADFLKQHGVTSTMENLTKSKAHELITGLDSIIKLNSTPKKSTEQEIAEMFQADELARDTN